MQGNVCQLRFATTFVAGGGCSLRSVQATHYSLRSFRMRKTREMPVKQRPYFTVLDQGSDPLAILRW